MTNHYHVVLRLGEGELWQTLKPLNMRLAQYHNKKYGHRGPLFMDRFKSIVTQDQNYIEELVRYVHLNPLRAGICTTVHALENYPWSGHRALMGLESNGFQDIMTVLNRFGKNNALARKAYAEFLSEGNNGTGDRLLMGLVRSSNENIEKGRSPYRWVIGDRDFVRDVIKKSYARHLRISRFEREGADFTPIALRICKAYGVLYDDLLRRHRGGPGSGARKCFCFVATRRFGATVKAVSDYLRVHPTTVSAMARKGKELAKEKRLLSI